jgi:hypothetical protein
VQYKIEKNPAEAGFFFAESTKVKKGKIDKASHTENLLHIVCISDSLLVNNVP